MTEICPIQQMSAKSSHSGLPSSAAKRLQKELMKLMDSPPDGVVLDQEGLNSPDFSTVKVILAGPAGTLYEGEKFTLQFKFSDRYPFDSPQVVFVGESIPVHPHIYSNGHICLSILTDDWSPAFCVETVCMSILSMLSSATEKKRPIDNSVYVRNCPQNPKKTNWWYHDDKV